MARLAFTVTNHSLTFFIKGRPYSLTKDHENYAQARAHLQTAPDVDHDSELLVDLVDARRALHRASFGRIQFDGNDILWQGKPLHGIWVDRILEFRAAGEDHTALFNALDRLVHNPTATAIERLPIFLDRVALPFMPDGRFLAFKGVTSSYESEHANKDGTRFTHQVGDKPRMPREEVDADPNQTCSTGLHVGAPGYVRSHYSGGSYALVLVAVDPVDVVSVPTDYNGEKMRVCGYEVIEHLDQNYSDELFGRLRDTYLKPQPEVSPSATGAELAALAVVGDTVTYADPSGYPASGTYEVVGVDDEAQEGKRLFVATSSGQTWLRDAYITQVTRDGLVIRPTDDEDDDQFEDDEEDEDVEPTFSAGQVVEYQHYGDAAFGLMLSDDEVRDLDGDRLAPDEIVRALEPDEITGDHVAFTGATVTVVDDTTLRDGTYTIAGYNGDGYESQGTPGDRFWHVEVEGSDDGLPILNSSIKTVTFKGEQLWPRTKVETNGETTTLTSLDGHDLRGEAEALSVAEQAVVGDRVTVQGSWNIVDGDYTVTKVDTGSGCRLCVKPERGSSTWVGNKFVVAILPRPEAVPLPGDLVEVSGEGWPPAGVYPVDYVTPTAVNVRTEYDGLVYVENDRVQLHQSRPWMRAEIGGYVTLERDPASGVPAGTYEVANLLLDHGGTQQIQVRGSACNWWVAAERVTAAHPKA